MNLLSRQTLSRNVKRIIKRFPVTPAQAGVHDVGRILDSRLRGNDITNHFAFLLSAKFTNCNYYISPLRTQSSQRSSLLPRHSVSDTGYFAVKSH